MLVAREGTTELLCTHNLPLAERICTRYGFLVDGSLAWSGTREELLDAVTPVKMVQITTERGVENHTIIDERQINSVIREGLTSKKIGERLFISERTVEAHIHNIYRKCDVMNRVSLINKIFRYT